MLTEVPMRRVSQFLQKAPWIVAIARSFWRINQPKFTAGVVGVVFNEKGQVLLVEHVFHPYAPWGLPGGWIDWNEAPPQTAVRELKEELELTVEVESLLLVEVDFGNHLDFAYLCNAANSVGMLSGELLDYKWYDIAALPKLHRFHYKAIQTALEVRMRKEATD
ncbi:MAG: NUDIX domain-containing protein [Anaerolineaceae bacterium]|nr:NUDIX domain-containing protein [Anaerolineaceae bacterium]